MAKSEDGVSQRTVVADGGTYQDFSLVRGGPFYRAQQTARLIGPDRWNLGRRVIFALAIGWVPLVILTALFHPHLLMSLLRDYHVNARLLLAVPVLLAGQSLMESRVRLIVQHVRDAKLLGPDDLADMDRMIATLVRWGDSWLPELLIIVMVYLNTAAIWPDLLRLDDYFSRAGYQRRVQRISNHETNLAVVTVPYSLAEPAVFRAGQDRSRCGRQSSRDVCPRCG